MTPPETAMSEDRRSRAALGPDEPMAAFLDADGTIVEVTESWDAFTIAHGGDTRRCGVGASYLAVCDAAADDPVTAAVAAAIRAVLRREAPSHHRFLSPCPGTGTSGWYELELSPWDARDGRPGARVVVAETALYVTDRAVVGELDAALLDAARARDLLVADELSRLATHRLFEITLALSSLAERVGGTPHQRRAVAMVVDLDAVIADLAAIAARLRG